MSNPNNPNPAPPTGDESPEAKARRIPIDQVNPATPEAHQAAEHGAKVAAGVIPSNPSADPNAAVPETDEAKRAREEQAKKDAEAKNNPTSTPSTAQRSAAGPPLRHS